jgi:hypothetical protein
MDHIYSNHRRLRSLHHWELYQNPLPDQTGGLQELHAEQSARVESRRAFNGCVECEELDFGISCCYQMRLFVSVSSSDVFTVLFIRSASL